MNRQEHLELLSQRSALERMIERTPSASIIDHRSLRARLDTVNRRLEDYPIENRQPAKARLTFRGRPVVGSHGIFAEFGMTAMKAFTDAVALVAASLESGLAATGPIPNRAQNQLLITSAAVGSFGFELEEYREGVLPFEDESPIAQALRQTQELFRGAAAGSDDELTAAASDQDPRAVGAVREFLKKLIDNEAICSLAIGDKAFAFSDVGEVRRGLERLGADNLHEEPASFVGAFQGVLPMGRTFEFRIADAGEVIRGKIGKEISDPNSINSHLGKQVSVQLVGKRVGQGRPRYTLRTLPQWS